MGDWDPTHYLRFGDERTRPSLDLVARIAIDAPTSVIDLGCGPGNSTQVLAQRWPEAHLVGLDSSSSMIDAARRQFPDQDWILGSIEAFTPPTPFDVVFSNAALHWITNHGPLVDRLLRAVAPGGALAFQIPSADHPLVRSLIHEIARDSRWAQRTEAARGALTMMPPSFYYDRLAGRTSRIDLWETEYLHVLESTDAVVDWIGSTGLRPFLDVLASHADRDRFEAELRERVRGAYLPQVDGKVLFPFKRTFVIAYA